MSDALVRSIVAADLDRILEINQANVPEVGPVDGERLRFLVDESPIALVVEVDGGVVGFCLVLGSGSSYDSVNYTWFMQHHPTSMYLDRVAFDAASQGRGLGRRLYAEVDRVIRAEHPSADSLTLEVNVDPPNEPSLAFHRRLGFAEVGRQVSKGIGVSLMRRDLASGPIEST